MAEYVIANNDYLESGYVEANFVGTASDLYVDANYVGAIVVADAITLSANATVTADATKLKRGISLQASSGTLTADADRIRTTDASVSSSFTTTQSADRTRSSSSTLDASATLSSDLGAIRNASATIDGVLSSTVTAGVTVNPGLTVDMVATLSGSANATLDGQADLITAGDEVAWEEALTWQNPRSEYWGPLFDASAFVTAEGQSSVTANFGLSVDAVKTAIADISVDGFASVTVTGNFVLDANATLDAIASITAIGTADFDVAPTLDAVATVDVDAIKVVVGEVDLNSTFTVTATPKKINGGDATLDAIASTIITSDDFRIRGITETLSGIFGFSADENFIAGPTILKASAGTLTADANQFKGPFQQSLDSNFTITTLAGKLTGVFDLRLNAFVTQLSALTIYNIDPFRVYTVPIESRTQEIGQETRNYTLKTENRVNTIEQETRGFIVPSETRKLQVQKTTLVENDGFLDRREG